MSRDSGSVPELWELSMHAIVRVLFILWAIVLGSTSADCRGLAFFQSTWYRSAFKVDETFTLNSDVGPVTTRMRTRGFGPWLNWSVAGVFAPRAHGLGLDASLAGNRTTGRLVVDYVALGLSREFPAEMMALTGFVCPSYFLRWRPVVVSAFAGVGVSASRFAVFFSNEASEAASYQLLLLTCGVRIAVHVGEKLYVTASIKRHIPWMTACRLESEVVLHPSSQPLEIGLGIGTGPSQW
jgi:hypothetical protein